MNNNGILKMIILLTLLLPVPCGWGGGGAGKKPTQPTFKLQYLENGKSKHSLYTKVF